MEDSDKKNAIQLIVDGVENVPDTEVDYDYSRNKYKELLDTGMEMMPVLKELAMESEHPRAMEVAFNALRQMADINDKLLNMHRKKQVIDSDKPQTPAEAAKGWGTEAQDGEIPFKGTTASLLAAMKDLEAARNIEDAEFSEVKPEKGDGED